MIDWIPMTWHGHDGFPYEGLLVPRDAELPAEAACYMFVRQIDHQQRYQVIYVGETSDLSTRFNSHHAMPCIDGHGATHLWVHPEGMEDEDDRKAVEEDLKQGWNPPCNG